MRRWLLFGLIGPSIAFACNESQPDPSSPERPSAAAGVLDADAQPRLQRGYQRFEPPPIDIEPGGSGDWAQWVGGPLDRDYDVVDITGAQSRGGHHALLYATTEAEPVGFTRLWQDSDQLTTRLMGGVGGEGGATVKLPEGIVFRVKRGSYLVIQTHYLNSGEEPIMGRTIIDMKLAASDPSHQVASIMANTTTRVELTPGASSAMEVSCRVQKELRFLQIANHMHEYGESALTDAIDAEGQIRELKRDDSWSYDWALNPNFAHFAPDDPLIVPAGSTLRTRCSWVNTADRSITFPTEMCVFFGFVLNDSDIYCQSGSWSSAGSASMAAPGEPAAPGSGACSNDADRSLLESAAFEAQTTACATSCGLDPDTRGCASRCLESQLGISAACAACNGDNIACGAENCLTPCVSDNKSAPCRDCVRTHCDADYRDCSGL